MGVILAAAAVLIAPTPATAKAPSAASPFQCIYTLLVGSDTFLANLYIINHGSAVGTWNASWTSDQPLSNLTQWGAMMSLPTPNLMTARNHLDKPMAARSVTKFGWSAKPRSWEVPDDITVNGQPCPVVETIHLS